MVRCIANGQLQPAGSRFRHPLPAHQALGAQENDVRSLHRLWKWMPMWFFITRQVQSECSVTNVPQNFTLPLFCLFFSLLLSFLINATRSPSFRVLFSGTSSTLYSGEDFSISFLRLVLVFSTASLKHSSNVSTQTAFLFLTHVRSLKKAMAS